MIIRVLFVAGTHKMAGSTASLRLIEIQVAAAGVEMIPYCEEGWFPHEGVLRANNRVSMTKELMTFFMEHVHRNSATAGAGKRYVVLLHGHSSRNETDIRWLEESEKIFLLAQARSRHYAGKHLPFPSTC